MRPRRRTKTLTRAMLILWTAVVVFPLLWMCSTAFKSQAAIVPTPKYIPWLEFGPTLDAFRTVLTQYRLRLLNAFENSVISASASAVAATILGALAVWIMRDAFRAVPVEIEESALVDGCSRLSVFWKVALPLAAPGLVASFIICLIFAWNEFLFALVLTFRRSQTLPVMIAGQATELGSYWWIMAPLAIFAVVPMILVGLAAQRWIVRGLAAGSVKG